MGLKATDRNLLFWTLLGVIGMLVIWNLPWRFQVNDDEIMMWLLSGAYTGKPESYSVFLHPILSWIFSKLYTVSPEQKWYPATWFLIVGLSYFVYLKLIWNLIKDTASSHLWSFFSLCLFVHFLFFLQFSIVSGIAISAGLAYRFSLLKNSKSYFNFFLLPDILIILGTLIRPEVLFLFLSAYLILKAWQDQEYNWVRHMVVLALILGFVLISKTLWINISDLGEFNRKNRLRSQVFDHPMLQLYKDDYKLSDPELYHFANGLIDFQKDSELDSKMVLWKTKLDDRRFEALGWNFLKKNFTTYIPHERFFIGLMVLFFSFALIIDWRISSKSFLTLATVVVLLSPFFLLKIQVYVIVFLAYFSFILSHSSGELHSKSLIVGFIITLSLALGNHFFSFSKSYVNIRPDKNLISQVSSLKGQGFTEIYLICSGNLYIDMLYRNPLPFRTLGWQTLLVGHINPTISSQRKAYLVDSATYANNSSYFSSEIPMPSTSNQVLLLTK